MVCRPCGCVIVGIRRYSHLFFIRSAPKRISQLELLIDRMEAKLASLDEDMLDDKNASDATKLMGLTKERELIAEGIAKLVEEWDELEDFVKRLS